MNLLRRNRAFRRLWIAGAISEAGDWLLAVALPVHVFLTTGSAAATSIVFLLGLAPAAVLGPIAGALVGPLGLYPMLVVQSSVYMAAGLMAMPPGRRSPASAPGQSRQKVSTVVATAPS